LSRGEGEASALLFALALSSGFFLLAQPVLSEVVAHFWRRDAQWLRYATAFNWCQWALPGFAAALLMLLELLAAAGLSAKTAGALFVVGVTVYQLWLHWFLLRHGLQISAWRAFAGLIWINLAATILMLIPEVAGFAFS
jgi:hypothetical protein